MAAHNASNAVSNVQVDSVLYLLGICMVIGFICRIPSLIEILKEEWRSAGVKKEANVKKEAGEDTKAKVEDFLRLAEKMD